MESVNRGSRREAVAVGWVVGESDAMRWEVAAAAA